MTVNLNNIEDTSHLLKNEKKNLPTGNEVDFAHLLKQEIDSTNQVMEDGQKAEVDIATGNVKDLAKANIAIEKADLKMQMMLEVRNKAISAYKELSKIQV